MVCITKPPHLESVFQPKRKFTVTDQSTQQPTAKPKLRIEKVTYPEGHPLSRLTSREYTQEDKRVRQGGFTLPPTHEEYLKQMSQGWGISANQIKELAESGDRTFLKPGEYDAYRNRKILELVETPCRPFAEAILNAGYSTYWSNGFNGGVNGGVNGGDHKGVYFKDSQGNRYFASLADNQVYPIIPHNIKGREELSIDFSRTCRLTNLSLPLPKVEHYQ
jgi:hypothetical protein